MNKSAFANGETAHRDIVTIGGSAGSLEPMVNLVRALPRDYPGSLFVVSHIGANHTHLPQLLSDAGPLPATHPRHRERIAPGRIYVAPPDRHLLLSNGEVLLSALPREHFTRPAIDPLFRSAAHSHGPRVVGIVLSGTGSDGARGLLEIRRAGGIAVVQDPAEASFPEMPQSALRAVKADHMVPSGELGSLIATLVEQPVPPGSARAASITPDEIDFEQPVALTCPECGGAVHEVADSGILTYRCHTGHRFGADELLVHQVNDVERAIMVAVRVLRERAALCRRMIGEATAAGRTHGVAYWGRLKGEADDQLRVLQQFLHRPPAEAPEAAEAETMK